VVDLITKDAKRESNESSISKGGLLSRPREMLGMVSMEPLTVFCIWLAMAISFGFISSSFWTTGNFVAIGEAGAPLAIVSIGQSLVLIAGEFDLSVGGAVGLGSVVAVLLSNAGIPMWGSALITIVMVGGSLGLVNGIASDVIGINPLIATLATLSITEAIAKILSNGEAVPAKRPSVGALAKSTFGVVPAYVWVIGGLFVLGIIFLGWTMTGRSLYVTGSNRLAAVLAGIKTRKLALVAFVLCAMSAIVGGLIESALLTAGDPTAGGSSMTLLSITAVVLGGGSLAGGRGGLGGTLTGVLLLATLADGLTLAFVPSFYDGLITGGVLLFAVGASAVRLRLRDKM